MYKYDYGYKGKVGGNPTKDLRAKLTAEGVQPYWIIAEGGIDHKKVLKNDEIQDLLARIKKVKAGKDREQQASASRRDTASMCQHAFWVDLEVLRNNDSVGQGGEFARAVRIVQYSTYVSTRQYSTGRLHCRRTYSTVQYSTLSDSVLASAFPTGYSTTFWVAIVVVQNLFDVSSDSTYAGGWQYVRAYSTHNTVKYNTVQDTTWRLEMYSMDSAGPTATPQPVRHSQDHITHRCRTSSQSDSVLVNKDWCRASSQSHHPMAQHGCSIIIAHTNIQAQM